MKPLDSMTYEPVMVDAKTAASLCGVSRSTFLGWDSAGLCPRPIRIGGRVLWATEDLRLAARWGMPSREEFERRKQAMEGRGHA